MRRYLLILVMLLPFAGTFAANGSVNYGEGVDALADILTWLELWTTWTQWTLDVVAAIVGIIASLQMYYKVSIGEPGMEKDLTMIIGAVIFIITFHVFMPALFNSIVVY